jgi:hypothetical protein
MEGRKKTLEVDIGKIKIRRDKKEDRSLRFEKVVKGGQQEAEEKKNNNTGVFASHSPGMS